MKAAITGTALRTPLGHRLDAVLDRLLAGDKAALPCPHFPADTYPCRFVAAIPPADVPAPSAHSRILSRMGRFALDTAREAAASLPKLPSDRVGLFAAMGGLRASWDELLPALQRQEDSFVNSWRRGLKDLHPFWMLRLLSNNAHALAAQDLGLRGEGATFAGSLSGASALHAAILALHDGAIDAALVMAYDSLIEPESLIGLAAQGRLVRGDDPASAAPYGPGGGSLPGEAAATLLLERADPAMETGRAIALVEVVDGADGEATLPAAESLLPLLSRLPLCADAAPDFVDGCAVACPAFDAQERQILSRLLPGQTPLIATQGGLGILGAATPVVQTIVLSGLLQRERLPPIAALIAPRPGPLSPLTEVRALAARSALGLSVGAPGMAAAVWVGRISRAGAFLCGDSLL